MIEGYLTVDGVRAYYRRARGDGVPVVYCDGNPAHSEDWLPFMQRDARPSIAIDMPGLRRSCTSGRFASPASAIDAPSPTARHSTNGRSSDHGTTSAPPQLRPEPRSVGDSSMDQGDNRDRSAAHRSAHESAPIVLPSSRREPALIASECCPPTTLAPISTGTGRPTWQTTWRGEDPQPADPERPIVERDEEFVGFVIADTNRRARVSAVACPGSSHLSLASWDDGSNEDASGGASRDRTADLLPANRHRSGV